MSSNFKKRILATVLTLAVIVSQCIVALFPVAAASYSTNDGYFHDQGGDYMSPVSPTSSQSVTLKLRVPSSESITAAKIQYSTNEGSSWTDISMSKSGSILDDTFNIWQGTVPATSSRYYYRFKLTLNYFSTRYYALGGLSSSASPITNCYQVWPDFSTPEWSQGAYWYYVAPTSFFNGDSLNDISGDMSDYVGGQNMNGDHYKATYGGDVKGVSDKLDYIKDLGCSGVYLNPLHLSYNANGYGIMNNYMLDSQYATENEYKLFVNAVHSSDMRVMFDVLAHSVVDANVWYNSYNKYPVVGAYNSTSSTYRDLFHFDESGAVTKFLASNALDYANDITKNLMYKNEDSYLSRYLSDTYGADALRFDAGAYLYGTGLDITEITADLTSVLKSRYPDKLLVCENYADDSNSTSHLTSGWDTCWNTPMIYWMRGLAEGTQTMSGFMNHSILDVLAWPRAMALSMNQLLTSHDLVRLQNSADETGRRMARIFQMTYVGSPMLYYGDETDAQSILDGKIEQFDWNTENWNMDTYSLVKGLGQLRNEYTCLKNGVVKFGQADDDAKTHSMARWDSNGAVISLLNGNSTAVSMTVNVNQFEVANGTVLTDYFTGKTYTVSGGSITASVPAGGTVLVTGGNTSDSVGKYNKTVLGSSSGTATVDSDLTTVNMSGSGSVTATADSGLFLYNTADGGFELVAEVTPASGSVALALRDTDTEQSRGYYAVINGSDKTISVYKREVLAQASTLVTTANYTADSFKIKLVRSGNNDFSVQVYENSTWNTLENSTVKLSLPSSLYAGAIQLSGTTTISSMATTIYDSTYYDGFISDTLNADFTAEGDYTIADGKLTLSDSGLNTYLADAPRTDWTAKAVVGGASGYAGVVAYANDNDYILGGRYNGQIVLARVINGTVSVYDAVTDTRPQAELLIQLQRVGNYFSLSYRYNDEYEWKTLTNRIFASYTVLKYGLASIGEGEFDYVTLGNMIDTGASLCTPISKSGDVEFNYSQMAAATNMVKWSASSGEWVNAVGGLSQSNTSGETFYITNSKFTDFKAEVTLGVNGSGYSGVIFGAESASSTNGYLLTLTESGLLKLNIGGTMYDQKTVSFDNDGNLRIIIERIGDRIIIYTNQNPTPAFNIKNTAYTDGYFGFTTNNAQGYFGNYTVFSLADSWTEVTDTYIGAGRVTYLNGSFKLNAQSDKTVAIHKKGIGYTDVLASVELNYATSENSLAGLGFGSAEGVSPLDSGIVVALKNNSSAVILKDGVEVVSADVNADTTNTLAVSVKNGVYNVYFNDLVTPVATYSDTIDGGVVCAIAQNTNAVFTNLVIDDLSCINAVESLGYYKASINAVSLNKTVGSTVNLVSSTSSITYTNNGYSYNVNNTSGYVNTEYVALQNDTLNANGKYEVTGILKSGASSLTNTNMSPYNAPTITFRKVTRNGVEGYLKLALTKESGGISIIFDTDYYEANNRAYLKYEIKYDDGTYTRNDSIDNYFKIVSDDKTVSVWLNGTLIVDSFDYSSKATNIAPAAGLGFNCCASRIYEFSINELPSGIVKNIGVNGSATLSDDNPSAGETVTITKNGTVKSGTMNAYYFDGNEVKKITPDRTGYRTNKASVDEYSFIMPNAENPLVFVCDFESDENANIAALGAQYRENGTKADIRFGTRLGYKVTDGVITVNGKNYTLIETGTLVTTVTALNTVSGTHEELVTLGSESHWGEQHKYLKNVKRTKYYDYCNEYIDFAVAVTGISDFDKVYVARGYALAKDESGNTVVFYTDIMYRTVNGVIG